MYKEKLLVMRLEPTENSMILLLSQVTGDETVHDVVRLGTGGGGGRGALYNGCKAQGWPSG